MRREKETRECKFITVSKTELLERLEENRAKHRTVFEAAVTGYRKEALDRLEHRIKQLKDGKLPDLFINLTVPEDHTRDYDRVIKMVQMHIGDTFELSEGDFGSYVMDDWKWKRQWAYTNSTYAAAAVEQAYGDENFSNER